MDRALERRYRIRVVLFLVGVIGFLAALSVAVRTINTLRALDAVESARDEWQRPDEILRALDLRAGAVVADVGSGAGYFALKLSRQVGSTGRVIAVDVRRTPLFFLWMRAALSGRHNIQTRLSKPGDPLLADGQFDGVLVLNTYHEFDHPSTILSHIFCALRPGSRLVVVDRGASADRLGVSDQHSTPLMKVEQDLREARFELIKASEPFIDRPDDSWWLLVARKPA